MYKRQALDIIISRIQKHLQGGFVQMPDEGDIALVFLNLQGSELQPVQPVGKMCIRDSMGEIIGEDYYSPSFYNYSETIDGIVKEGKSLVRFGDGEFDLMAGRSRHKFQHYDEILSRRLQEIIQLQEARLMVAVADNYGSLEKYNEDGKQGIRS